MGTIYGALGAKSTAGLAPGHEVVEAFSGEQTGQQAVKLRRWGYAARHHASCSGAGADRSHAARDPGGFAQLRQQEIMMKLNSNLKSQAALAAAISVLSIGSALAGGETLSTGNVDSMGQWYGRAGGLTGSERVMAIGKASTSNQVGITYDKDVAQRTNMQRDAADNGNIGITYDKDVAARTNMSRGEQPEPIKAAGTH